MLGLSIDFVSVLSPKIPKNIKNTIADMQQGVDSR